MYKTTPIIIKPQPIIIKLFLKIESIKSSSKIPAKAAGIVATIR